MKYFDERTIEVPVGFYLKEGHNLYTYCSNCGSEHEYYLKTGDKIKDFVKSHCQCPACHIGYILYNAKLPWRKLNFGTYKGEFVRTRNGFKFDIYHISYNFSEANYDYWEYAFKRSPCFDEELCFSLVFEDGKKVRYYADQYLYFFDIYHCVLEEKKNFPYFHFSLDYAKENLICMESLKELRNTNYEFLISYIEDIFDFTDNTIKFLLTLVCIWNNQTLLSVYKSGFKRLVVDYSSYKLVKNPNYSSYYGLNEYRIILNLRKKNINDILRVDVSKIKVDRDSLDCHSLLIIKKLIVNGLDPSIDNIELMKNGNVNRFESEGLLNSKVLKYLRNQKNKTNAIPYYIARDYIDYIMDLKKLSCPLTKDVMFPTNLAISHTKSSHNLRLLIASDKNKVFKESTKQYEFLTYFGKDYSIELVESSKGLINASKYMHNCSATYIDSIINGNCLIFLVKSNKKQIDGMLELRFDTFTRKIYIGQLRGKYNESVTANLKSFVDNWFQNKVLKLCA